MGVERDAVREGLRTFAGIRAPAGARRRDRGVLYVNDSKATNVGLAAPRSVRSIAACGRSSAAR
jgi:UDP-N-acetylmuramoylalanine--D-glutamate ligase